LIKIASQIIGVSGVLFLETWHAHAGRVDDGRALVERNCAACHSISRRGTSPYREAPPFRDLHRRYPIESLAEALAEGISTGHPAMPEFVATPTQIDAILSYIKSLSGRKP
jgi:mono/diheme cytochrome c family protein